MDLRYYQEDAITAVSEYLAAKDGNPCVVLPTGAGKSIVIAELIRRYTTQWPETRIIVLAHVKELVQQNHDKLINHWPETREIVGIYSAGLRQKDTDKNVIFASIQSCHKKAKNLGTFDLILVDEAHRIPTESDGMYRAFIREQKRFNPYLRVIGFTATPYRLGRGYVIGEDYILNEICYNVNISELIDRGYLSNLITKGTLNKADLSNVHVRAGEYIQGELHNAVCNDDLVRYAVSDALQQAQDRNAFIWFAVDVGHAEMVCNALQAHGERSAVVVGDTPAAQRDSIIADFNNHKLRHLINVAVLTEGFDAPHIDVVSDMAPTLSPGRYYQKVGRGLRLFPGKKNCLILDYASNIETHGPIDELNIKSPNSNSSGGKAPQKMCEQCNAYIHASVLVCQYCGFEYPKPTYRHDVKASDAAILRAQSDGAKKQKVEYVLYQKHEKEGKPPSFRVDYMSLTGNIAVEWICLEHEGYARSKAKNWWKDRDSLCVEVPTTIDEALKLTDMLKRPEYIYTKKNGDWKEIVAYEFVDETETETEAEEFPF